MFRTGFRSADFPAVRVGALGLAAVLVLGGCSGSGEEPGAEAAQTSSGSPSPSRSAGSGAEASGTASASASPTPTPSVAAYKPATAEGPAENVPLPVMPELAKEESKEGLEAFAEYWYALANYGLETGNTLPLEGISGADCELCVNLYRMMNNGYKNDDWVLGGKLEVVAIHSDYVLTSKQAYQVLIQVKQAPLEYRGPQGTLYGVNDGINPASVHMVEATYSSGGWRADNAVLFKAGR